MDLSHLLKKRLFTPGPTAIPLQSQFAAVDNNPYHRSESFNSIIMNSLELLKVFFGTRTNPMIFSSSGTGAMEAALVNLTDSGSRVLMVVGGKFGERWAKMAKVYGCETVVLTAPSGTALSPDVLKDHLEKDPKYKAVFFQAVETSTGVYFPVKEYVKIIREKTEALIVVDVLSSILAHEFEMDEWGVDCAIAAGQKGFGVGPGLSFVAISERARTRLSQRPRFYFNFEYEMHEQVKGKTAWTPATQLILSLHASLKQFQLIGRESLYKFHQNMCFAVRQAVLEMGLSLYVKEDFAYSVTTLEIPKNLDGEKLKSNLQKNFHMTFAGGQDDLKGKILRLAHLGFVDPFDLLSAIAALELTLTKMQFGEVLGKGTSVFMKNFPI